VRIGSCDSGAWRGEGTLSWHVKVEGRRVSSGTLPADIRSSGRRELVFERPPTVTATAPARSGRSLVANM